MRAYHSHSFVVLYTLQPRTITSCRPLSLKKIYEHPRTIKDFDYHVFGFPNIYPSLSRMALLQQNTLTDGLHRQMLLSEFVFNTNKKVVNQKKKNNRLSQPSPS